MLTFTLYWNSLLIFSFVHCCCPCVLYLCIFTSMIWNHYTEGRFFARVRKGISCYHKFLYFCQFSFINDGEMELLFNSWNILFMPSQCRSMTVMSFPHNLILIVKMENIYHLMLIGASVIFTHFTGTLMTMSAVLLHILWLYCVC